jgi:putative ribosome biogenesis GTPase RsgA
MKIDFEFTTKYGVFKDCLHLSDDAQYTNEELDLMKSERLNNWIRIIETTESPVSSETTG